MNRNRKLFQNTVLMAIGTFTNKFLVFLLVPIYTHTLSTSEYGIADILVSSINLVFPIFTLLMSESVLRFSLDQSSDKSRVFSTSLYMQLIGTAFLLLLSPLLLISPLIKPYFFLIIGYYILRIFRLLITQFIRGVEQIKLYTISNIIQIVVVLVTSSMFLYIFDMGITGFFLGYILGDLVSLIYSSIMIKIHNFIISPVKLQLSDIKSQLRYSLPMIPNSIGWWINTSIDRYAIVYYINIAASGIYSIAYKIPSLLTSFSSVFIGAWQISSIEDFGSSESEKFFSNIYKKYSSFNILLTGIILISIKILAKILFSATFYEAWSVATIIMFSFLFQAMSAFLGTVFTAAKKTKTLFYSTITASILNISLNIFLIPKFGINGAAYATLITYFYIYIHRLYGSMKIIKIDKNNTRDVFSYIIIAFMIYFINISTGILSFESLVLYMIILVLHRDFAYVIIKEILIYVKKLKTQ